jgi:hypothetical protein
LAATRHTPHLIRTRVPGRDPRPVARERCIHRCTECHRKRSFSCVTSCVISTVRLLLLHCRSRAHTYCDTSCIHPLSPRLIYVMLAPACYRQLKTNCCRPPRPQNGSAWARTSSGDGRQWRSKRAKPASANAAISPGTTTWRPRLSGVNTHGHRKGRGGPRKTSHQGPQESPTSADRNHLKSPGHK